MAGRDKLTLIADPTPDHLFCPIYSVDDHVLEPPTSSKAACRPVSKRERPSCHRPSNGLPLWVIDGTAGRSRWPTRQPG